MSKRLIQDLHAGISRRDWWAVETAANRLRDEVEKTIDILAGTGKGSLPNDYPLSELAADAVSPKPDTSALLLEAEKALEEIINPVAGISLRLRETTQAMASLASVDMELWDRHSNACLSAADCIEQLDTALGDLMTWFPDRPSPPEWRITAGERGADDAVAFARSTLSKIRGGE